MNDRDHRRLKVCFVIPSLAGGGAERVAVQVLNALSDQRWDRSMYLFEGGGPYVADVSSSIRLEIAAASSRPARWRALRRFIRRARPDVVVAFLSYLSVRGGRRRQSHLRDRHANVGVPDRRGLSMVASVAAAVVYDRHAHRLRGG